jgi:prevent-host-death family protein
MATVGARELKTRLGKYLKAVREGATLLVTERGEPVAELRPAPASARDLSSRLARMATQGLLTPASGARLPPFDPAPLRGPSLSREIVRGRGDRF